MKSRLPAFLFCALMSTLAPGCANLKDKAVVFGGSVEGFKLTTDVDAGSGSPTPMPKILAGWFSYFWADIPVGSDTGLTYFQQEKSIWSDKPASTYFIHVRGGLKKDGEGARVTIMSGPDNVVDTPVISVANPASPNTPSIIVTPAPVVE